MQQAERYENEKRSSCSKRYFVRGPPRLPLLSPPSLSLPQKQTKRYETIRRYFSGTCWWNVWNQQVRLSPPELARMYLYLGLGSPFGCISACSASSGLARLLSSFVRRAVRMYFAYVRSRSVPSVFGRVFPANGQRDCGRHNGFRLLRFRYSGINDI